jgi:hypothetical protein
MMYERADLSVEELEAQAVIELPQRELLQNGVVIIIVGTGGGGGGGGGAGGGAGGGGG